VPSGFLEAVFKKYGYATETVPNIIDFSRFSPLADDIRADALTSPRLLVARNLELIYDNASALRAFKIIHAQFPKAHLTIAGAGPELANLQQQSRDLELEHAVTFTGRVENQAMSALYRNADIMLNPTTADNMPISILESLASGVPVVSTDAGGIPFLVKHEQSALLVPVGNSDAMAQAVIELLNRPEKMAALKANGLELVKQYTWPFVSIKLLTVYRKVKSKLTA